MAVGSKGKQFRKVTALILRSKHVEPFTESIFVTVDLVQPDNRKRDVDNILKCVLDSCEHGGAFTDDSLISKLLVTKYPPDGSKKGKVIVTIKDYAMFRRQLPRKEWT